MHRVYNYIQSSGANQRQLLMVSIDMRSVLGNVPRCHRETKCEQPITEHYNSAKCIYAHIRNRQQYDRATDLDPSIETCLFAKPFPANALGLKAPAVTSPAAKTPAAAAALIVHVVTA